MAWYWVALLCGISFAAGHASMVIVVAFDFKRELKTLFRRR